MITVFQQRTETEYNRKKMNQWCDDLYFGHLVSYCASRVSHERRYSLKTTQIPLKGGKNRDGQ